MKHDFIGSESSREVVPHHARRPARFYHRIGKPVFDCSISLLLLPVFLFFCGTLLILNPFLNKGPLFFIQPRMGRNCKAFPAIKFRTMKSAERITRSAEDPLEVDRITTLGSIIRKTRIDELPQILNVLRGEMSLIGPRPDYFHHARRYVKTVRGYRQRHQVRPGISGLAQTELGYVNCSEGTQLKVQLDLRYVENLSFQMDVYVFRRTLETVFGRKGC
ncbi:MAG: sugar transferase [Roseovarius sp.]|uniref:sugar transferase n=1 Tax=Roseovarius sp. TaxID=1486281 RepID=UPI0032EAF138